MILPFQLFYFTASYTGETAFHKLAGALYFSYLFPQEKEGILFCGLLKNQNSYYTRNFIQPHQPVGIWPSTRGPNEHVRKVD